MGRLDGAEVLEGAGWRKKQTVDGKFEGFQAGESYAAGRLALALWARIIQELGSEDEEWMVVGCWVFPVRGGRL